MTYRTTPCFLMTAAMSTIFMASFSSSYAEEEAQTFADALAGSKILFNSRIRYENVDQEGRAEEADALTYRLRAGFETAKIWDSSFLVEFEHIEDVIDDFNSTTNGKTQFPVVPDPNVTEVNRLQITNTSLPDTKIILGRQRIILDDARFVGNVGWRQNEQTYDAVRVINKSIKNLIVDASYVNRVNRFFGDESPIGSFDGDSFLLNTVWNAPISKGELKVKFHAYYLDFDNSPVNSSKTIGGRVEYKAENYSLTGAYAAQSDYANQPVNYDADYYLIEGKTGMKGFTLHGGYEVLTGDGTKGFATPLATLHKFNGWADQFLVTPPDGLKEAFARVGYGKKKVGPFDKVTGAIGYHDYQSENTEADLGSEIDFVAKGFVGKTSVIFKYADYNADSFATDTAKLWFEINYAL